MNEFELTCQSRKSVYVNNCINISDVSAKNNVRLIRWINGILPTNAILFKSVFKPMATNEIIRQYFDDTIPIACMLDGKKP